jgi:hypothetical protein
MANGYSQSPKLLKGALIRFSAATLIPVPNIIVFQYNPESLTRTLTSWAPPAATTETDECHKKNKKAVNALAQPFDPEESLSLKLELDATDALEEPDSHPVAVLTGVADRIAAIEMLMYPSADEGSSLRSAVGSLLGGKFDAAPRKTVPVVLFFWGPGRIVPVRITSLSVEETAYSPTLYPIRAQATLGLQIIDPIELAAKDPKPADRLAMACYVYTRAQKEALALANVANSAESIMGMLPF